MLASDNKQTNEQTLTSLANNDDPDPDAVRSISLMDWLSAMVIMDDNCDT